MVVKHSTSKYAWLWSVVWTALVATTLLLLPFHFCCIILLTSQSHNLRDCEMVLLEFLQYQFVEWIDIPWITCTFVSWAKAYPGDLLPLKTRTPFSSNSQVSNLLGYWKMTFMLQTHFRHRSGFFEHYGTHALGEINPESPGECSECTKQQGGGNRARRWRRRCRSRFLLLCIECSASLCTKCRRKPCIAKVIEFLNKSQLPW